MKLLILITAGILGGLFLQRYSSPLFVYQPVQGNVEAHKTLTDLDMIAKSKHPVTILKIYGLESSFGKNDGCKRDGKFNGFGFGQNKYVWNCFDSFQEVVDKVDAWLTTRDLENYCLYNVGTRTPNCVYAQNMERLGI